MVHLLFILWYINQYDLFWKLWAWWLYHLITCMCKKKCATHSYSAGADFKNHYFDIMFFQASPRFCMGQYVGRYCIDPDFILRVIFNRSIIIMTQWLYFDVEFINYENSAAFVPETWVEGKKRCFWPPSKLSSSKVNNLLKNFTDPKETRPSYAIKILAEATMLFSSFE